MTHTTYRILSCDGGGIRGVITAKLLQALDPSVIKTSICLPEPRPHHRPRSRERSSDRYDRRTVQLAKSLLEDLPALSAFGQAGPARSGICGWRTALIATSEAPADRGDITQA
jgi:hypothetical protein